MKGQKCLPSLTISFSILFTLYPLNEDMLLPFHMWFFGVDEEVANIVAYRWWMGCQGPSVLKVMTLLLLFQFLDEMITYFFQLLFPVWFGLFMLYFIVQLFLAVLIVSPSCFSLTSIFDDMFAENIASLQRKAAVFKEIRSLERMLISFKHNKTSGMQLTV